MKEALLTVSFGTAVEQARQADICAVERSVPHLPAYQAYTSPTIRRILARRGIDMPGFVPALEQLAQEGAERVYVLPTHVLPGYEYDDLLEAAGQVRRKIRVDKLRLKVTVGAEDPADAAMRYGRVNGALGALWGTLNEAFDLRDGRASAVVDFDARTITVYALASLSLKVGQMVWLGLYFGCRALRAFLRVRGRRKQEQQQRKAA